jgi:hypothetical protein
MARWLASTKAVVAERERRLALIRDRRERREEEVAGAMGEDQP